MIIHRWFPITPETSGSFISIMTTKFSFEFFPPASAEKRRELLAAAASLGCASPEFFSITYGAGGSTRETTSNLAGDFQRKFPVPVMPHLTCAGHTRDEITRLLETYARMGIGKILAMRGDPPKSGPARAGDFPFAAELVTFIRQFSDTHGHHFEIGVAGFPEGHPATPDRLKEIAHLRAKVDCGADFIITQLFFDNRDFHDFRERCDYAGISVPVIAGLLPLTAGSSPAKISAFAGGSRFPVKLLRALDRAAGDPTARENIGLHHATTQAADLIDHDVPGIHFYTLNRPETCAGIFRRLGISHCGGWLGKIDKQPELRVYTG